MAESKNKRIAALYHLSKRLWHLERFSRHEIRSMAFVWYEAQISHSTD